MMSPSQPGSSPHLKNLASGTPGHRSYSEGLKSGCAFCPRALGRVSSACPRHVLFIAQDSTISVTVPY